MCALLFSIPFKIFFKRLKWNWCPQHWVLDYLQPLRSLSGYITQVWYDWLFITDMFYKIYTSLYTHRHMHTLIYVHRLRAIKTHTLLFIYFIYMIRQVWITLYIEIMHFYECRKCIFCLHTTYADIHVYINMPIHIYEYILVNLYVQKNIMLPLNFVSPEFHVISL